MKMAANFEKNPGLMLIHLLNNRNLNLGVLNYNTRKIDASTNFINYWNAKFLSTTKLIPTLYNPLRGSYI